MPYYICRVVDENGRVSRNRILAPSVEICREQASIDGKLVLSVRRDWKQYLLNVLEFGQKIKDKDIILFNQELLALLKAGYPVLRSLEAVASRAKNLRLKEILIRAADDVRLGKAISEAFRPYEKYFSTVYTASLMAGERSGNLPATLGRYIQYIKVIAQTKSRIKTALTYPTLLLIFGLFLMAVLVGFVLPRFADFYLSFEAELPFITRFVMSSSIFINRYWYVFLLLLCLLIFVYLKNRRKTDFRLKLDRLKLRLPFGGQIWLDSGIALFSRTLGLLLEAGLALLPAVNVAIQAIPNMYFMKRLDKVPGHIENGESLTESLSHSGMFPGLALDMVRIGETSANLHGMLADMADFFDERIRGRIDTLISLIEPVVIILVGIVVAGMLLSVYLPIFNIIRITR